MNRLKNGEEIMKFCFDFLENLSEERFSLNPAITKQTIEERTRKLKMLKEKFLNFYDKFIVPYTQTQDLGNLYLCVYK